MPIKLHLEYFKTLIVSHKVLKDRKSSRNIFDISGADMKHRDMHLFLQRMVDLLTTIEEVKEMGNEHNKNSWTGARAGNT
ncbi:predicted protein [Sclerotinia sclerotiorum 1980 UF-70]|uniref:Uncharacterized protein n=1 Tax=Sclerotinia sclerotiorum (strain ATCC 18683 / 1980 / Ss-1) TaxID=665079 RepID=A7EMT2_SCLS1|nr:predicted protein [Sclerotinia sclerotiorum 1980 UF-70]EDO04148.1 predicted protein [Sclerotinia sclerotiorum 1980 UF-70]